MTTTLRPMSQDKLLMLSVAIGEISRGAREHFTRDEISALREYATAALHNGDRVSPVQQMLCVGVLTLLAESDRLAVALASALAVIDTLKNERDAYREALKKIEMESPPDTAEECAEIARAALDESRSTRRQTAPAVAQEPA